MGRILPPDEQPQPVTSRGPLFEPSSAVTEPGTPRGTTAPTAHALQALGDYMAARLSGRSAQDALDLSTTEGQAPGEARQSLSRTAVWYQDNHATPQEPAAAAGLLELLDPVARLRALGERRSAVSPQATSSGLTPDPLPAPVGSTRSQSPTLRSAAATFLGLRVSSSASSGRVSAFDSVASATRAARPPSLNP